jgi:tetratricopeptide (TPR) repeat protein
MRIMGYMIVLFLTAVAACSTPQEKAEQSAATALALADAGNFATARVIILQAIRERDDVASHWQLLGRIDLELGKPADALLAFSRVLELDASNLDALQLVAELSFQFGNNKEAISAADRLLALEPNATRAILVKGLVALERKRAAEALNAAESILKINPQDEFGIVLKARAVALGKDYKGALKLIEEGVPSARRTEASLATLIELYRILGDTTRLISTMDQQLARRPKDTDLKLQLGQVLYKAGNPERARTILLQVIKDQPNNIEVVQEVSDIWLANDSAALTPIELDEIARNGSATMRTGVARYLIGTNRPDLAELLLRRVETITSDVSSADAKALYATALYKGGNVKAARAIADQILNDDKGNSDALLLRARIALQERNLTAALNDVQIVVRDFPMNEQGRIVLADVLLARKDTQRARQSYEEAISDMPQNLVINRAYTDYLFETGDKSRAIDVARIFTQKSPSSVAGWEQYASVCRRAGNLSCMTVAQAGREKAAAIYTVDDRPGSTRSRGLFGRLL